MAYTTVVAGTTATASWANANVRDQVVSPFASSAARASAITAPVSGMVSTLTAADATSGIYHYNGTSWRQPWNMPWGIMGTATVTAASSGTTGAAVDWSGLAVTWTAVNNRYYRTTLTGLVNTGSTGGDCISLVIRNGSTQIAGAQAYEINVLHYEGLAAVALESGLSGSQTRKASIINSLGTNTVAGYADTTWPAIIVVEDMGPSGAPV